jgi:hypothetical protein
MSMLTRGQSVRLLNEKSRKISPQIICAFPAKMKKIMKKIIAFSQLTTQNKKNSFSIRVIIL